jgi:hypothetical protein
VLPLVVYVSPAPSFRATYPYYRLEPDEPCWPNLWCWEAAYLAQFYLEQANREKEAGNAGEEGRLRATGKDWARNAADMDSKWQSLLNLFE